MPIVSRDLCPVCCDYRPIDEFVVETDGIKRLAFRCEFCRSMPSPPDGFRYCRNCRELKPLNHFQNFRERNRLRSYFCATCRGKKPPSDPVPDGMKRCSACKEVKTIDVFHKGASMCKVCHKAYREANADRFIANTREWQRNNPDKVREYVRRYWKRNPEKATQAQNRRKALVGDQKLTDADVEAQYNSQHGLCWWCGKAVGEDYHVDHRIPLSRGGLHTVGNICISCPHCNQSKNNKMPWEWNGRLL